MENELIDEILEIPSHKWRYRSCLGDAITFTVKSETIYIPKLIECNISSKLEYSEESPIVSVNNILVLDNNLAKKIIEKKDRIISDEVHSSWDNMIEKLKEKWLKRKKQ